MLQPEHNRAHSLYGNLTAVEKNSALRNLYTHYPTDPRGGLDAFDPSDITPPALFTPENETLQFYVGMNEALGKTRKEGEYEFHIRQRANASEFRQILDIRHADLLRLSPHITEGYANHISFMKLLFESGGKLADIVALSNEEPEHGFSLGIDQEGMPGIFDAQRGLYMERYVYKIQERVFMQFAALEKDGISNDTMSEIAAWRKNLINKLHDEP